ncbi:DNA-binding transcriptional MerR regulator [Geodermatophilus bullaregiensis]|uniref:MerR family transcriptional regulator n=1 Tax=Geodermatophilus bullaregiensis TaxID=1564160 RepID=UPI0019582459|nr:MerR family transcriptional regulator [Geodermatophilus bullaregiensis]MBM7807015.1 DNA-binding transcriptional MerR regulator [Geodermatophilus bullaregiensis]
MSERLMRIGELAEKTGLSLPTIRHYDETGLLSPSARTAGNFRLYSEADYQKLMVIRRMKPLGFSVEEMRQLLVVVEGLRSAGPGADATRTDLLGQLRSFIADAAERRRKLQRNLERADEFIGVLRSEEQTALETAPGDAASAEPRVEDTQPA